MVHVQGMKNKIEAALMWHTFLTKSQVFSLTKILKIGETNLRAWKLDPLLTLKSRSFLGHYLHISPRQPTCIGERHTNLP